MPLLWPLNGRSKCSFGKKSDLRGHLRPFWGQTMKMGNKKIFSPRKFSPHKHAQKSAFLLKNIKIACISQFTFQDDMFRVLSKKCGLNIVNFDSSICDYLELIGILDNVHFHGLYHGGIRFEEKYRLEWNLKNVSNENKNYLSCQSINLLINFTISYNSH